jgi:hypothetical protein
MLRIDPLPLEGSDHSPPLHVDPFRWKGVIGAVSLKFCLPLPLEGRSGAGSLKFCLPLPQEVGDRGG